jgi:uncharacterized integral membrane protein (TIGR00698 family)
MPPLLVRVTVVLPGLAVCSALGAAAALANVWFGWPTYLVALLAGMMLNASMRAETWQAGIDFAGQALLRAGIALLACRITFTQLGGLGLRLWVLVAILSGTTLGIGLFVAKALRRPWAEGWLTGAACGICGASAALAVSSVLPSTQENKKAAALVVAGVTFLSTCAMFIYPLLARSLSFDSTQAGIFLGGAIHDVAQVIASSSLLSANMQAHAMETATVVKLARVLMLLPVVFVAAVVFGTTRDSRSSGAMRIPGFIAVFAALLLMASAGLVPAALTMLAGQVSSALLLIAVAACGLKIRGSDLREAGVSCGIMLLVESAWIAAIALIGVTAWS